MARQWQFVSSTHISYLDTKGISRRPAPLKRRKTGSLEMTKEDWHDLGNVLRMDASQAHGRLGGSL